MRMLSAFALVVFLASLGGSAFAGAGKNTAERPDPDLAEARELNRRLDQALPQAARWLLEHTDPRRRAAGLLFHVDANQRVAAQAAHAESLATDERFRDYGSIRESALDALTRAEARYDELQKFEAPELLDRFEKVIRTTTDGAALAWLATACANADIGAFCVDAGLDEAIVRHDGANLFSRLALFPGAQAETRDRLIIEAENTQNYVSQLPVVWFEALDEGPGAAALKRPHDKLVGAFSISMAYGIPAYKPVTQACGGEITPGGELDLACGRIAERMIADSQTSLGQMIGFSLASSRAEARGDQAAVARLEQRKVYENAVHSCRATALRGDLENLDESDARHFMKVLDQHGEIEAWARLAAQHDIDCSNPNDPTAEAMEEHAEQLEGDS